MKEPRLMQGECCIREIDDKEFVEVVQNGRELHFRFKQSQNGKFIVVWRMSLNPEYDRNKQVCLIENNDKVLWCEEFEVVETCYVSNNGTVVVLVHNLVPMRDIQNRPGLLNKDLIVVIPPSRDKFQLNFSEREEIMAMAMSQNGEFLVYNLQRYRPDDYQLVFHNIQSKQVKWRYRYSKKQIITELVFKDGRILVYARPRSPDYVGRRYRFTLDLTGKKVPNDPEEMRKQKERDSLAAREDDLAGQVGRILRETLAGIVPTIEVDTRCEFGTRMSSRGWSSIMSGGRPLPALHIMIYPDLNRFHAEPSRAKIEEQGCNFFFHMQVVAKTAEERDKISKDCVQTLIQQEGNLEKRRLVFSTKLDSRKIGHYPGSGPYFRTDISCMLIFPAKQRKKQEVRGARTWRDLLNLQSNESIVIVKEVFLKSPFGNLDGNLVLTTKRFIVIIKKPMSQQFKILATMSPAESQNVVFGGKDEKYIVRQGASEEARIYFRSGQDGDFEAFRREFESFRKRERKPSKAFFRFWKQ